MFSPQRFSREAGISYNQVLHMCKSGDLDTIKTDGGHFKIPEKELIKYKKPEEYVSKEEYEEVIRENERLKTMLLQAKTWFSNLDFAKEG